MTKDLKKIKGLSKVKVARLKLVQDNGFHRLYMLKSEGEYTEYYQIDNNGNIVYRFKGKTMKEN